MRVLQRIAVFGVLLICANVIGYTDARAETFVVIPLVGDRLTVFFAKTAITAGANAERRMYAINDPRFDTLALSATESAIRKLRADASVVMAHVNDRALYTSLAHPSAWKDWSSVTALLSQLSPDIVQSSTTRLVLIVPTAGRIKLPIQSSGGHTAALPEIAGLGFYVDNISYYFTTDSATIHSPGLVYSFASIGLVLVNPSAHSIERGQAIVSTRMLTVPEASHDDPWEKFTSKQKADALRQVLDDAIDRLVPALLGDAVRR